MSAALLRSTRRRRGPGPWRPRRNRPPSPPHHAWPGADPARGPVLFLDQLALWDAILAPRRPGGPPEGPRFDPTGCEVRRMPPRGSFSLIGKFMARNHYTSGPGMRGLPFGLYRGEALLGVAVFSRVCRPRWAAENFRLLPSDRARSVVQRRHLTVTDAEYTALSRLALRPADSRGAPLGNGAATWFLSRCLAGLEARNRLLWSAHQHVLRGLPLAPEHLRLLREAAGADRGRGRGYLKGVVTWADPYEAMIGHIYQVLSFHYTGRTNGGRWTRESVGARSGRRLSARTLAKARSPRARGHAAAALRLAWEGAEVTIEVDDGTHTLAHSASWVRAAAGGSAPTEPEISAAIDRAWSAWRRLNTPTGAAVSLRWRTGTGVRVERFPSKHAYFVGLGAPWYRRQTEIRHRPLTERLLADTSAAPFRRRDRRRDFYPTLIPPGEIRPDLRHRAAFATPA